MNKVAIAAIVTGCLGVVTCFPMPAQACGDSEAPVSCSDADNSALARWLLTRVVTAVKANEPDALRKFSRGEGGFRTADLYVFCMGTQDGRMSAHNNPALMGQDARQLADPTGKHFAAEMLDTAQPGRISEISYLFPRPGSDIPVPKTSYITRVNNQVCGVGYYDQSKAAEAEETSPATQVERLQARLEREMPQNIQPLWHDFTKALAEDAAEKRAKATRLRDQVKQIEASLSQEAASSSR